MTTSTVFPSSMQRISAVASTLFQKILMLAGMLFVLALAGLQSGNPTLVESLKALQPDSELDADSPEAPVVAEPANEALSARMLVAMDYVSRRYRVAPDALQPIFATAQVAGRQLHLDPLLIIAVIGIESRFNPFSESVVGAKGLMQVMPRFHQDKLPEDADQTAFLNPVINVQVGARILKESIRRNGGLENGLQQFAGAIGDPERRYSNKVLAEKLRLEQAVEKFRTT
ncbi:MAG: transglycosylase SLT domain-containing protein [Gammaproteobacteria bacterium]|nr:transglycosylase SLT domain-containing protein [Gammaproteobacteria bacterium]MBU1602612.1 transglycosylase SLT domain-containing protein [Gammaproteobacteria bacterium]MBU2433417.1 transglycosylase SLT domain-containing protein [Gammaproteobacteria bacterium]MBU2451333.1 transglycosylase SLT domain-containing protein [Gammaproteobacteria bacterium]